MPTCVPQNKMEPELHLLDKKAKQLSDAPGVDKNYHFCITRRNIWGPFLVKLVLLS